MSHFSYDFCETLISFFTGNLLSVSFSVQYLYNTVSFAAPQIPYTEIHLFQPLDSTVKENAGIEPFRTVGTSFLHAFHRFFIKVCCINVCLSLKDTCLRKQSSYCRRRQPRRHWGATRQRLCSRGRNWPPPPGRWPARPLGPQLWGQRSLAIRGVQWSGEVSRQRRSVARRGQWGNEWSGDASGQGRSVVRRGPWAEKVSGQGEVSDLGRSLIKGGSMMWGGQWSEEVSDKGRSVIRQGQWSDDQW